MEYRFATEADLDLLAEWNHQLIRDEGHRNPMTVAELRERMRQWLDADYKAVLFLDQGEAVAYGLFRQGPNEVYLRQFFVRRDKRRKGLGREAIALLRESIWFTGKRLTVEVLSQNKPGIQFWRDMGYKDYSLTLEIMPPEHSARLDVQIRRADRLDLDAITEIYNEAVLTSTATFDTEPKTTADRLQWFQSHGDRHPILVAVVDGHIVGWASITQYSERRAYDDTAETSFYVKSDHHGRGIGRRLKGAIIEEARRLRFHTLLARVTEGNEASLHLNEAFGFVRVGTLKEVGRKFGRLLDVHILQKILD